MATLRSFFWQKEQRCALGHAEELPTQLVSLFVQNSVMLKWKKEEPTRHPLFYFDDGMLFFICKLLKVCSAAVQWQKTVGCIQTWTFLCGICMLSLCLSRLSLGTPASLIGDSKLSVGFTRFQ